MVRILELDSMGPEEIRDNQYLIVANTRNTYGVKKLKVKNLVAVSGGITDSAADAKIAAALEFNVSTEEISFSSLNNAINLIGSPDATFSLNDNTGHSISIEHREKDIDAPDAYTTLATLDSTDYDFIKNIEIDSYGHIAKVDVASIDDFRPGFNVEIIAGDHINGGGFVTPTATSITLDHKGLIDVNTGNPVLTFSPNILYDSFNGEVPYQLAVDSFGHVYFTDVIDLDNYYVRNTDLSVLQNVNIVAGDRLSGGGRLGDGGNITINHEFGPDRVNPRGNDAAAELAYSPSFYKVNVNTPEFGFDGNVPWYMNYDSFGHATTVQYINLDSTYTRISDVSFTVNAGDHLDGGGALSISGNKTITIDHPARDPGVNIGRSVTLGNLRSNQFIQGIVWDAYGHPQEVTYDSVGLDTVTYSPGIGINIDSFGAGSNVVKLDLPSLPELNTIIEEFNSNSRLAGVIPGNFQRLIRPSDIDLAFFSNEVYNFVTDSNLQASLPAVNDAQVTFDAGIGLVLDSVSTGNGIFTLNQADNELVRFNLYLPGLAIIDEPDPAYLVATGATTQFRVATSNINVSNFTNDANYITADYVGLGSIALAAGTGISGGGVFSVNQDSNYLIPINLNLQELDSSLNDSDGKFFVVVNEFGQELLLDKGSINLSGFNNDLTLGIDSASIIDLIDSAYIQARQADIFRDSAFITDIVDSAYINARVVIPAAFDSSDVYNVIAEGNLTLDADSNLINLTAGDLFVRDGTTTRFTFERTTGNFTATGNVTAFSDERLKSNIITIDNGLDLVTQLRGVRYEKDGQPGIGLIAQEVEQVIPEAVHNGEYKSIAYGNIVAVLIEAIKDLSDRIEKLENRS